MNTIKKKKDSSIKRYITHPNENLLEAKNTRFFYFWPFLEFLNEKIFLFFIQYLNPPVYTSQAIPAEPPTPPHYYNNKLY